jgi:hypothetical protein
MHWRFRAADTLLSTGIAAGVRVEQITQYRKRLIEAGPRFGTTISAAPRHDASLIRVDTSRSRRTFPFGGSATSREISRMAASEPEAEAHRLAS